MTESKKKRPSQREGQRVCRGVKENGKVKPRGKDHNGNQEKTATYEKGVRSQTRDNQIKTRLTSDGDEDGGITVGDAVSRETVLGNRQRKLPNTCERRRDSNLLQFNCVA